MKPRIFSIHSYKGGVGKTTIALSIAATLAQKSPIKEKVCLIDLDFVGPSIGSLFETQLKHHKQMLYLPYWFDSSSGSPHLPADDILHYLWRPKRTEYQKTVFAKDIHLLLCPPTSLGIQAMERAYLSPSLAGHVRRRIEDLFDRLFELGYKYIVVDNAPGFRDYSLTIWSILSGLGSQARRIIVSSPAYADIGGIMYQIDSLVDPLGLMGEPSLWWLVNFLHGEYYKKAQAYESLVKLARLVESTKSAPQKEAKIMATLQDRINYDSIKYYSSLARMCFVKKLPHDWFRAIPRNSFKGVIEKIVTLDT